MRGHPEPPAHTASPPQVIYKKFQIPCPLPEQGGNITSGINVTLGSEHWDGPAAPLPPEVGACTPSFFTLNSQVDLVPR